jgi:ABC-type nitrate/sulfonate/bicarbonate transport system substrate-binding protein
MRSKRQSRWRTAVGAALVLALVGCSTAAEPTATSGQQVTLRLAYFPNVTHATALVGDRQGIFERVLGEGIDLRVQNFNAGGAGDRGYLRWGPGCDLYRAQPGNQWLHPLPW